MVFYKGESAGNYDEYIKQRALCTLRGSNCSIVSTISHWNAYRATTDEQVQVLQSLAPEKQREYLQHLLKATQSCNE